MIDQYNNTTGIVNKLVRTFGLVLIIIIGLISCEQNKKATNKGMRESTQGEINIKQDSSDLLIGLSKAVCYSGFRTGQHPDRGDGAVNPSYDEVLEDLIIISDHLGFKLIRVYDCAENTEMVLRVIEENDLDIKVMLGIWLKAELSNHLTCEWLHEPIPDHELRRNKELNLKEIEKALRLADKYNNIIVAVNVGNEALVDWNDHKVSVDTMISYVKYVSQNIVQPVTVADNYIWWAENGAELAKVVDFVSIHTYPVWEGKDINEGLTYTLENIKDVKRALPNSIIVISEAGWPSIASEFGERASEDKQLQYYNDLMQLANENNITTFWFEAFDEDWKGDPGNMMGAEKHWGLYTVNRKPKKVVEYIETHKVQ